MLLKIIQLSRHIRSLFCGLQERKEEWYLFNLQGHWKPSNIRKALIPEGYQYNPFSTTYKGQIWTCRKLMCDGWHQIHLRFYHVDDCTIITGHYELDPLMNPGDHLRGEGLRALDHEERLRVQWAFFRSD